MKDKWRGNSPLYTPMSTLYRKYRPARWAEVAGQNHIKVTLAFEAQTGRLAHAYLFSGPRGVGKTTVARIFAKAINCLALGADAIVADTKKNIIVPRESGGPETALQPNGSASTDSFGEPCGSCSNCQVVTRGSTMDIIEIDAASNRGIDNVRDNIIESARFAPGSLKFKVFVIDEVHMLTTEAFNALLKTLEEPPARTVFILATTELHKVPATIVSRCQRFDFRRIPHDELLARLKFVAAQEDREVDERALAAIARHADGGLRDAEGLLGKILSLGDGRHISYDEASVVLPRSDEALVARYVEAVLRRETAAALDAVAEAGTSGVDMDHLAAEITETLRRILLTKLAGADAFDFGLDDGGRAQLTDWAALADTPRLVTAVETMMTKRRDIKGSHIPQLPLELAAVRIAEDFATTTSAVAGFTPPAPVPIRQPKLAAKKEPVIINSAVAAGLAPLTPAAADSSVVENRHLEKKYDVPPTVIGGPETTKAEPIKLSQSISADEKATVAVQPLATRHFARNYPRKYPYHLAPIHEESGGGEPGPGLSHELRRTDQRGRRDHPFRLRLRFPQRKNEQPEEQAGTGARHARHVGPPLPP